VSESRKVGPSAARSGEPSEPRRPRRAAGRVDAAVRDRAAGREASWARSLGATLPAASGVLGALWNDEAPVPDDVRSSAASWLGCAPSDLTTYAVLARRMLRELPAHLPPRRAAAIESERPRREGPSPRRRASVAEVMALVDEVPRTAADGSSAAWARCFGASLAEAARTLSVLFPCAEVVPLAMRSALAQTLGADPAAIATYAQLSRLLVRRLPSCFPRTAAAPSAARWSGALDAAGDDAGPAARLGGREPGQRDR
jgi:hypothetical protein